MLPRESQRRNLAVVSVLLSATLLVHSAGAVQSVPRAPRPRAPKLVVLLVIDQMRADYADKFHHQWKAGLRRIFDRGAWFRQAAYPYVPTVTCAGHATIATGTLPWTHGMILNVWWDRAAGKQVACIDDPNSPLIPYGEPATGGTSTAYLAVPTLTDELRAQLSPPPRIVSMALKPRSAVLLAGHQADAATWLTESGTWTTSISYAKARVGFIERFIRENPHRRDAGKVWNRALPEGAYLYPATALGKDPPSGWTSEWPHVMARDASRREFDDQWEASPFADEYVGKMATAAVHAVGLGQGDRVDFLGVSFSALDVAGHAFGPASHEIQDILARLDVTIGRLLADLDRVVGSENYILVLSADHGVAPIPEQLTQLGIDAGRIWTADVIDRVEQALTPILGPGKKVATMLFTEFYFLPGIYERLLANPAAMRAALNAIRSIPGVARVFRSDQLRLRQVESDSIAQAALRSYYPGRSGDLLIVPEPYWIVARRGTTHGSANAYDTRVPIVLLGGPIRPGEYLQSVTPADIAPTLAFLCGVTLATAEGRILSEALATSSKESAVPGRSRARPEQAPP